jgi:succinate-semialdehyde dehydrogenase/glutarate-semialdehyde dehydrogenase
MSFSCSPLIKKLSFTGSTYVGKILARQSSDTVKRLSMELGGNAPFVVFDDADIDQAVNAAISAKFRNAGQTCVCADRFLVASSVHDVFVERLIKKVEFIRVGPGLEQNTNMGPLITIKAKEMVAEKVKQAIRDGAVCEIGGKPIDGQFYQPTVLTNVSTKSEIWNTETFGPVAAIKKFDTEEEALSIANDSSVGLASYFCTNDLSRAFRFSERLECGLVGVNEGIMSSCVAPFGGVKESGMGREGSHLGLAEYLETKYIFMNS